MSSSASLSSSAGASAVGVRPVAGPWARPLGWLIGALLVVAGAWALWQSQRLVRADFISMEARQQVADWEPAFVPQDAARFNETREDLERAIDITPENPDLHDALAALWRERADRERDVYYDRHSALLEALDAQKEALALRPMDGGDWARLANTYHGLGNHGPEYDDAIDKALQFAPVDPPVHEILLDLVFATWDHARPEMQAWATAYYANAPEESRKYIDAMAERYGLTLAAPGN